MQLLVSPRDLDEAARSLAADIIDVKKPSEGSLGANFPWVIRAVRGMTDKPVSAAIGDFEYRPGGAALAASGAAHAGADFIKIGLLFNGEDRASEMIRSVVRAVKDDFPKKKVVIAAYSDSHRLGSISPFEMVPLAAEGGADFAMIDTGIKDGKSTFDFLDEEALTRFTAESRRRGLGTAIAGSLHFEDLPSLKRIGPDIIGVRGMVCGGDRSATIREDLVLDALRMVK